jgi:hypothetical protein
MAILRHFKKKNQKDKVLVELHHQLQQVSQKKNAMGLCSSPTMLFVSE